MWSLVLVWLSHVVVEDMGMDNKLADKDNIHGIADMADMLEVWVFSLLSV